MYRPQKKLGQDFMAWPTTTKKYNQSIPSSSLLTIWKPGRDIPIFNRIPFENSH